MSTKRKHLCVLVAVFLTGLLALAFTAFFSYKAFRMYNPYVDREISGPLVLSDQWLEIEFKEPLYPERPANEISIVFAEEYAERVAGFGLILPDGQLLSPEIQLVDVNGKIFELNLVTSLGPRGFSRGMGDPITWKESLPRSRQYRAVRIRSEKTVQVLRVFWRSYDPSDFK